MLERSWFVNSSLARSIVARLPLVFWCLFTFVTYLMLIELPPKQGGWPYWDKVQHLLVFALLTTTAFWAYSQKKHVSVIALVLYGAIIEWLQGLLTITRMPSVGDWLADVAGVLLTYYLSLFIAKQWFK